jgi:hypothetical protein
MRRALPKSTDANQTGRHGITILQERLERDGWVVRRQDGDSDFGIDCEIEIVDENRVTGRLMKAQVKSSETVNFTNGETSVQVRTSTYNLWRETPLPTVLFLVDTNSGAIYWTPALAHYPAEGTQSLAIRFDNASDIRAGLTSLRAYLDSWFSARAGDAIMREIPVYHRIYEELSRDVDHYDDPISMNEEQEDLVRLFHGHVMRLRLEVGLSNRGLPTLDDWYMRNAGIWNETSPLSWATFSELMKVVGPAYKKALDRIIARVENAQLTVENQDLWNFVDRRKSGRAHVSHTMSDERSDSASFHKRIERKLEAVGGLKFKFKDRE